MADEKIKKLLVNVDQQLTEPEKAQGRANLGIEEVLPQHVLTYDQQTLSTAQKLQVKQNLGFVAPSDLATVATTGDYNDLNNKPAIPPAPVQSDWNSSDTTSLAYIQNKPQNLVQDASYVHTDNNFTTALKDKLDGIAAGAEVNVQANWTETNSSSDAFILNKPNLATVATSGSYNDLSNKPTIPAAQVNSDWNASSGVAQILNKPSLATVATTGSYNDLTDKPTIPSGQVQTNWTATSGMGQILNKPTLGFKNYGDSSVTEASSIVFDADDPDGYVATMVNNGSKGYLVQGPYKTLLDSGVSSSVGDADQGIYIDSNGTFQACNIIKGVKTITTSSTYQEVTAIINSGYEPILKVDPSATLSQYFQLSQINPDGSMEFTCVRGGSSVASIYKYSLNSNSQWTRTDLGVGQYSGTAPVTVNNWDIGLADGGITYKKISNTMWRKLTASRYNEAYTTPSNAQIIRGSTSDAGRILTYVWDEKANDQFYLTRSTEQGYASQFIHIDFSCDVRPYSSAYDPTNDTKFNIALVCQNAGGSFAYLINSEQTQRFNMGKNFNGIHQIHATFDIETDKMPASYDTHDPELCIIFSARADINPPWWDTTDGLVFENQRISGFCWGHP